MREDGLDEEDVRAADRMVDDLPVDEVRAYAKAYVRTAARSTFAAFYWEERSRDLARLLKEGEEMLPSTRAKLDRIDEMTKANAASLARIEAMLQKLTTEGEKNMSVLDDAIANLNAQAAAESNEVQSAVNYIKGEPALIASAVQDALAAGATPAQLASINAVAAGLQANVAAAAAAIAANTPSAAPATPAPAAPAVPPVTPATPAAS